MNPLRIELRAGDVLFREGDPPTTAFLIEAGEVVVSMFVFREYVDLGGLMSYGPNRFVLSRRMADYVNRVARGAKPNDLPIERPTIFETVINLRTAKSLGLKFSQAMGPLYPFIKTPPYCP